MAVVLITNAPSREAYEQVVAIVGEVGTARMHRAHRVGG